MDLTSAVAATHTTVSGISPAEPSDLESTHLPGSPCESRDSLSPPLGEPCLPIDPLETSVEEPAVDALPPSIADEAQGDGSPAHEIVDVAEPQILSSLEEPAEPQDEAPAHHCEHEDEEEEAEEPPLE